MSTATAGTPEKAPDDSSKLKTFLSILRKYAVSPSSGKSYRDGLWLFVLRNGYADCMLSVGLGSLEWQISRLFDSHCLRISWNRHQT